MSPTVIFDLDGTLADTSGDLIAAANACFTGLGQGVPLDPGRDAAVAFLGGRAMLRLGFDRLGVPWDDGDVDVQYPVLLAAYEADIDLRTKLYPGALAAVERLTARGCPVGICTNKPEGLAETLLQRMKIRDRFDALVGADTLPVRKPDPAPLVETVARAGGSLSRTVLIGDTNTDRQTAHNAGVASILVTFGPAGADMAALAPDALLDHYDDLDAVLDRLFA